MSNKEKHHFYNREELRKKLKKEIKFIHDLDDYDLDLWRNRCGGLRETPILMFGRLLSLSFDDEESYEEIKDKIINALLNYPPGIYWEFGTDVPDGFYLSNTLDGRCEEKLKENILTGDCPIEEVTEFAKLTNDELEEINKKNYNHRALFLHHKILAVNQIIETLECILKTHLFISYSDDGIYSPRYLMFKTLSPYFGSDHLYVFHREFYEIELQIRRLIEKIKCLKKQAESQVIP